MQLTENLTQILIGGTCKAPQRAGSPSGGGPRKHPAGRAGVVQKQNFGVAGWSFRQISTWAPVVAL